MQDSFEDIVYPLADALVSPGIGGGELVLAVIVAFALLVGAICSVFFKGDRNLEWWER